MLSSKFQAGSSIIRIRPEFFYSIKVLLRACKQRIFIACKQEILSQKEKQQMIERLIY